MDRRVNARISVLAVDGDRERQHGQHAPRVPFPRPRSTHPRRRFAPATYSRSFVARAAARLYACASATRARPPRTCTREAQCEIDRLDIRRPHFSDLNQQLLCKQEERYRCTRFAPAPDICSSLAHLRPAGAQGSDHPCENARPQHAVVEKRVIALPCSAAAYVSASHSRQARSLLA